MRKFYSENFGVSVNYKFKQLCRIWLLLLVLGLGGVKGWGQTNNYFGTSGALSGIVWSTIPGGPYTSPLSTAGGAIINFGNTTTIIIITRKRRIAGGNPNSVSYA